MEDENVDGIMVINMMKSCFFLPEDARVIGELASASDKPIVDIPCGGDDFEQVSAVLKDYPIPTYNLPVKGARALRILYDYWKIRERSG
jgi:acyl-CoA synthetase (NDP forming)